MGIYACFAAFPSEALNRLINGTEMESKKIYPAVIWVLDGKKAFDFLLEYYQPFQEFYADAAACGYGVVQWLI